MSEESENQSTMPLKQALEKALKIARQEGHLLNGVNQTIRALERGDVVLVVMAKDIDKPEVVQTITALCKEKGVSILKCDTRNELGLYSGFFKLDLEKNPRKVVKCSCLAISSWGRESPARSMILAEVAKIK